MITSAGALKPATRIHPERLAWGVLLLSFAAFCVLCIASTLGLHYFFFRDTVPMDSLLQAGRGTVGMTTRTDPIEQSVRDEPRVLFNRTRIRTDGQSQAVITFRDSQRDGRLVAAVTVKRNTSLRFDMASQGRFDWSAPPYFYDIALANLSGEVDVFVPENLPRDVRLIVTSSQNSSVSLLKSGRYIIDATDTRLAVINREGQAVLFADDPHVNRSIPEATQGVYTTGSNEIGLSSAYIDLLANSSFEDILMPTNNDSTEAGQIMVIGWGCTNPGELPRGAYRPEVLDGRLALRLVRAENASTHGETRCVQAFPEDTGMDVTEHSYLALRATFYVKYQSLSACGVEASECPLMLRIDYHDVNGNPQQWFHGFYSRIDPAYNDYPLQCNSCAQEHESIYPAAWYTYDSGNLFTAFPQDKRPARIDQVWFYASGHQYDVFVSEVSLLAGQADNAG